MVCLYSVCLIIYLILYLNFCFLYYKYCYVEIVFLYIILLIIILLNIVSNFNFIRVCGFIFLIIMILCSKLKNIKEGRRVGGREEVKKERINYCIFIYGKGREGGVFIITYRIEFLMV